MAESDGKPKAKRASRAGGASQPATEVTKAANAGKKARPIKPHAVSNPLATRAGGNAPARGVADGGHGRASGESAPRLDRRIRDLAGWREETLARMRTLILEAVPEVIEEQKWRKPSNAMAGVPVWSHNGIICTGEIYTKVVKLTFARGAAIPDPSHLFNSSLEGNTRRAIDIREGEEIDAEAFKALVKAAASQNGPPAKMAGLTSPRESGPVKLLSGGNPQIAKADGDAPVQAYIAAMPGWKSGIGSRLDALIARAVPGLRKAVKWNSPFYGVEGQGWFLSFHCFTKYIKVAFLSGSALDPLPPGSSKDKNTRYLDIREGDDLDEAQIVNWVRQAAALPGWIP